MDQNKLREGVALFFNKQNEAAKEMEVDPIYLNQFLNGKKVGPWTEIKITRWVEAQRKKVLDS